MVLFDAMSLDGRKITQTIMSTDSTTLFDQIPISIKNSKNWKKSKKSGSNLYKFLSVFSESKKVNLNNLQWRSIFITKSTDLDPSLPLLRRSLSSRAFAESFAEDLRPSPSVTSFAEELRPSPSLNPSQKTFVQVLRRHPSQKTLDIFLGLGPLARSY